LQQHVIYESHSTHHVSHVLQAERLPLPAALLLLFLLIIMLRLLLLLLLLLHVSAPEAEHCSHHTRAVGEAQQPLASQGLPLLRQQASQATEQAGSVQVAQLALQRSTLRCLQETTPEQCHTHAT
jgi:hypothetical protein